MPTFSLTGINVGTFNLGEADRIVTFFSRERGLHRAVAKGARKPGTKLAGKSEPLNVNRMLLAKGKNLDIITQCETIESFQRLRRDLERLAYSLYLAELTQVFGQDLTQDCEIYFDKLALFLGLLAESDKSPGLLALEFEFVLLDMIGINPELDYCVGCRDPLTDRSLKAFNYELGGLVCDTCFLRLRNLQKDNDNNRASVYVTPLVWKHLIIARGEARLGVDEALKQAAKSDLENQAIVAARRLMQGYLEYKAGKKFRSLEMLPDLL